MDENSLNDCNKILGELARVDNDPVFGSNSNVLKTHLKQLGMYDPAAATLPPTGRKKDKN